MEDHQNHIPNTELDSLRQENERLKNEVQRLKVRQQVVGQSDTNIFRLALAKVSDAICMTTIEGDVIYTNQQFRDEYGITDDIYTGKVYDLAISTPSEESFKRRVAQMRLNGGSLIYHSKFDSGIDHTRRYHQISLFLIDTDQGEVIGIFMQDITEFVKSRDELRELNMLFDTILDNLPVYLFVKDVDDDFRYLYWNKAFAQYAKIPASKVIGNTDFDFFPSYDDARKFRADDMAVVESKEPMSTTETYESADGTTRMVQTLKTLCPREGRGPLLIGVSIDITSVESIEQELVRERLRAEQSDRLKSTFLANMSHEIRTPLNAIVGFSNLLTSVDDPDQKEQFVEIINQNSESLLQLINDILDISKIEAGTLEYNREPMDLPEVLENIYESQRLRMPQNVDLLLNIDPHYPHLVINEDRNRITQVVNNLINNAAKFTQKGEIRIGYRVKGNVIDITVRDTGIGIAPEKINSVFDRFVKLDPFAKGTGLGLSICKLIANQLGGDMSCESVQGRGSIFHFTIPYKLDRQRNAEVDETQVTVDTADNKPQTSDSVKDSADLDKVAKTILIAEDNYSNYLLLKTLLGKSYQLVWAKDGANAVELFSEYAPDLILMDIKMPVMDGLAATRLIRSHSQSVPIVALTAYAFQSDRHKALEAGMNDFLTKPVSPSELNAILDKYLK